MRRVIEYRYEIEKNRNFIILNYYIKIKVLSFKLEFITKMK